MVDSAPRDTDFRAAVAGPWRLDLTRPADHPSPGSAAAPLTHPGLSIRSAGAPPESFDVAPIYAKAGERVTCENGHVICEFSRDTSCGASFVAGPPFLCNWTQPEPKPGDSDVTCKTCGARFYEGLALHFADGFRYALPEYSSSPTGLRGAMRPGLGADFTHEAP